MANVDKYFPMQGTNKFQTVSFPIVKGFKIDLANTTGATTYTLFRVPKGSIVLGFSAIVRTAMESTNAATLQLGFTGVGSILSTAHGSGAATVGTVITGNSNSALSSKTVQMAYVLTADDTFDCIVGTNKTNAGVVDVFLTYIPVPGVAMSTSDFLTYHPGSTSDNP